MPLVGHGHMQPRRGCDKNGDGSSCHPLPHPDGSCSPFPKRGFRLRGEDPSRLPSRHTPTFRWASGEGGADTEAVQNEIVDVWLPRGAGRELGGEGGGGAVLGGDGFIDCSWSLYGTGRSFPPALCFKWGFKWWILRNKSVEGFTLSSAAEELFAPGRCLAIHCLCVHAGDTNCSMKCLRMGGEK